MKTRSVANLLVGALVSAAIVALSTAPSAAFTLSTTSVQPGYAAGQVEKAWWWHHRHCWVGPYGHWHCRYW